MKTNFLLFLFMALAVRAIAQQNSLHGVVSVFNSKFETGKTAYLSNAMVEEEYQRAQPTLTTADGVFKLVLVGIQPRYGFRLTVTKEGYEVVNGDKLQAVAGQLEVVRIFMAPKGQITENKRRYYKIGKTASEKALENKITQKKQELAEIRQNRANEILQIKTLEKEISDLTQLYQSIDQSAQKLAERFSRVNLDDASELYQRAFRQFQNGHVDSALLVLDEMDWAARVDSILIEEARLISLKDLIEFNDSLIFQRRDSIIKVIRIKIQAHQRLGQHQEAFRTTELLIGLFQDPFQQSQAYQEVVWSALIAQKYALAKLYAQSGLTLMTTDITLQTYLAYAHCLLGDLGSAKSVLLQIKRQVSSVEALSSLLRRDFDAMGKIGLPSTEVKRLEQLLAQSN